MFINSLTKIRLPRSRLAAVSQQRTAADCALSRRSPLLRDCDGAEKVRKSYKNNHSAAKGFTLIEVIVAISIGILIMTTFMAVVASGFRNIRTVSQTKELHANAVYILNALTYEIKQAEKLEVPEDDVSMLTITQPDSDSIIKKYIKEDEDNKNITLDDVKLNGDNVEITDLNFIQMPKSVKINFTITAGEQSLPVATTIAQRNNL